MADLRPVRGTHDLLPEDFRRHRHVVETAREVARRYGFQGLDVPIFEFTDVFARSLGETSDVVSKEMYTFLDRGGESITLRPELTAGIARAYVSNALAQQGVLKAFAAGPNFRYERPQKGRLRQFHQVDVEIIGSAEPAADIETIAILSDILDALGIRAATTLELNTLGDSESRAAYRAVLVEYFQSRRNRLSEDSQTRLERNPLRILDSKDEGDRELVADAPILTDHLNATSRDFFSRVRDGLAAIGIEHTISPRLVRGLDYYCHTAFEFVTTQLGSQGSVGGGGRYDGLIAAMGGRAAPGVGFAAGVERLAMLIESPPASPRPVAILPLGEAAERRALALAHEWRRAGLAVDMAYSGNLSRRLKQADRAQARLAVILGDNELASGRALLRDLDSGTQSEVALDDVLNRLRKAHDGA